MGPHPRGARPVNEQHSSAPFLEYVRLLIQLHKLIQEGRDESEEGEAIRDEMDGPGNRLTEEEKNSIHQLSADLDAIGDRDVAEKRDATIGEHVTNAIKSNDWMTLLNLLQEHALHVSPATRARLRGDAWLALGLPVAACLFYQDAIRALWPSESTEMMAPVPVARSPRPRRGHFPRHRIFEENS